MLSKIVGNKLNNNGVVRGIHVPASNTAAVVTLTALAGQRRIINAVQWSYTAAPTGGRLTISDGTTRFDVDITAAGPGGFGLCIPGDAGTEVVITLAAGGAGIVGKLNVQSSLESD